MMNVVRWISRLTLGAVLVVAAIDKIAVPDAFAASISAYGLIPAATVNLAALFLPWVELLTGLALIGGVYSRAAATIAGALMAVFIVAISSALLRGLTIDCGCFGKEHLTPVSWWKVAEDAGLLVLSRFSMPSRPIPGNS